MNYLIGAMLWVISCLAIYLLGGVTGYARGTDASTVVASAAMASDRARNTAIILLFSHEDSEVDTFEFADSLLLSDIETYYRTVGAEVDEPKYLKPYNYFNPPALQGMTSVAEYLVKFKSPEEIENVEAFSRVVNDFQN